MKQSATSATTTPFAERAYSEPAVRPLARRMRMMSGRAKRRAGARPKRAAAARPANAEKASTIGSMWMALRRGTFSGPMTSSSWIPNQASPRPRRVPRAAMTTASTSIWRTKLPPVAAQCRANGKLAFAQRNSNKHEVRHVGAGDEQQKDDRTHEGQHRRPRLAHQVLLHGLNAKVLAGCPGDGIDAAELLRDGVGLGLCAIHGDAGFHSADDAPLYVHAVGGVVTYARSGPDIGGLLDRGIRREEQLETGR